MTWIKICGITNLDDALAAANAGADALGFVFYKKSPRFITTEAVASIIRQLPRSLEQVGVFVDHSLDEIERIASTAGLTGFQLHAKFPHSECTALNSSTKKYFVLRANELLQDQTCLAWYRDVKHCIHGIFLDAATDSQPGGTGQTFDWHKAAPLVQTLKPDFRIVVAGGLTVTNVAACIRILKPWGVDVSTGVESAPGKKDHQKVRAFIQAVREADSSS